MLKMHNKFYYLSDPIRNEDLDHNKQINQIEIQQLKEWFLGIFPFFKGNE